MSESGDSRSSAESPAMPDHPSASASSFGIASPIRGSISFSSSSSHPSQPAGLLLNPNCEAETTLKKFHSTKP